MNQLAERSIGDLVREDFRRADIFEELNIDFCCGGKKSLKQACEESSVDINTVFNRISKKFGMTGGLDANYLEADKLCDYIERKHHEYVKKNIPVINAYIKKVYEVHGRRHPELATVKALFSEVAHELIDHLEKEETVVFPVIRIMTTLNRKGGGTKRFLNTIDFKTQLNELNEEHETAGQKLNEISLITNNYDPPANACNTYRVMLARLDEFEKDLHIHIHLENNILFPHSVKLEQKLKG